LLGVGEAEGERRSGGADCLCLCLQSKSQSLKVKWQQTLAKFCPLASDCTENRGLLVAQALLQVTAKLAQQANFLAFCEKALASSRLPCLVNQILGKTAGLFSHSALGF